MCGRYYIDQEEDRAEMRRILDSVNRRFKDTEVQKALKTGEIVPGQVAPALRPDPGNARNVMADLLQWGFPAFTGNRLVINARSETALEKPMFAKAMQKGRLLIPANAFFEWQLVEPGKKKKKIKLFLPDEPTFYMAGLARFFQQPASEKLNLFRFVILTTAANESVAPFHDRMPLIIPRRALLNWLRDDEAAVELLKQPVQQQLTAVDALS